MSESASTASPLWVQIQGQVARLGRELDALSLEVQQNRRNTLDQMIERDASIRKELMERDRAAREREYSEKRDREESSRFWFMAICAAIICVIAFCVGLMVGDAHGGRHAEDHTPTASSPPVPAAPTGR